MTKVIDIIEDDEDNDVFEYSCCGDFLNNIEEEDEEVLLNDNYAEEGNRDALDNCNVHNSDRINNVVLVENNRWIMVDRNELFEDAIEPIFDENIVRRIMPDRDRRLPVRLKDYDLESSFLTNNEVLKSNEKYLWQKAINEEKESFEKNNW